jgi:nucleoside diphosphate kinase
MIEFACSILKPDAHIKGVEKEVFAELKKACDARGFSIIFIKKRKLTRYVLEFIYQHIKGASFFPDFLELMQAAPSTLIFIQGTEGLNQYINHVKGSRASTTGDRASGIRGKFCSILEVSKEDVEEWELGIHPEQMKISKKMIYNLLHCSDDEKEALRTFWVFTTLFEKTKLLTVHPQLCRKLFSLFLKH